jgi:hypothetical protein
MLAPSIGGRRRMLSDAAELGAFDGFIQRTYPVPAPLRRSTRKEVDEAMIRSRRLLIVLSAIVLVLSLLAGLAAASTGFFGLANPDRVETGTGLDEGFRPDPVRAEEPRPGEERSFPRAWEVKVRPLERQVGRTFLVTVS